MLDGLERADGPARLHARLRVLDRQLEDALGGADHLGARASAPRRRAGRSASQPRARGAEHIPAPSRDARERHLEELLARHGGHGQPPRRRPGPLDRRRASPAAARAQRRADRRRGRRRATKSFRPVERAADSAAQRHGAGLELAALLEQARAQIARPSAMSGSGALLGGRSPAEQAGTSRRPRSRRRAGKAGAAHLLDQEHDVEDASRRCRRGRPGPADRSSRARRARHSAPRLGAAARLRPASSGQWLREEIAAAVLQESLAVGGRKSIVGACRQRSLGQAEARASPPWCAGSPRCRRRWCGRGSSGRRAGSSPPERRPARGRR